VLKYQIQLALRNIWKNRFFSFITTIGMTIGMTTFLLISAWVNNELSFDSFFQKSDRIFRFTVEVHNNNGYESHFARCWQSWTREMPDYFPQIKNIAFFAPLRRAAIKKEKIKFNSNQVFRCNPGAFEVFDIHIIDGDPSLRLTNPYRVLIAESMFKKYFNKDTHIGQRLDMAGSFETEFKDYEIAGIFKDFPPNSHFHPEILVSYEDPAEYEGWAYTYFLLHDESDVTQIIENFPAFVKNHEAEDDISSLTPHLQPLKKIHLYSNKDREIEKNGDIKIIWLFISIGGIVLILSLINHINFNLALIIRRKNHFVIQKLLGSTFSQYSLSILVETMLILFISSLISMFVIILIKSSLTDFLPVIKTYPSYKFIILLWGVILIVCFIAASIPQLIYIANPKIITIHPTGFSKQSEISLLKSNKLGLRKALVIFQFTISVILIACAIYIQKQNNYLFDHRMGKNMGPVVVIPELNWTMKERNFEFKNQLLESHLIKNVAGSMEPPSGYIMDAMNFEMEGYENFNENNSIYVFPVDDNFLDFFRIPILAGENFSPYDPDIIKEDYVINQTAMNYLGFQNPEDVIGREFKLNFVIDTIFHGGTIKAVVKDFHLSPLHEKVKPLVMFQKPIWYGTMLIEIDSSQVEESIAYIHSIWEKMYPDYYLDYRFSDDMYNISYQNENKQSEISKYLTILAIIVASLGMLGMSTIKTQMRTREICIRKVTGANSKDIFIMLLKDFTSWVFLAIILAIPSGLFIIQKWRENYPYKIEIPWWIFLISGFLALIFAWLSVGFQTMKAARQNPVEALRYE